ncbi:MAG: substrate-binding domain-containing protein [Boseongicola sp. SB0677_bin_26]|nr:substrate-binding domain-containing protein [Boseongicola sp. SB0665_bin_10]MYG28270.1 substrate-binding domain-containing protein [Boseongicola sp. SB0677_bin_26]
MRKFRNSVLLAVSGLAMSVGTAWAGDWCSGQTIRLFSGGPAGGAFNSIIDRGAMQAADDTGANVQIIYSDWDFDKMVTQLREAISQAPDGIAMMGHPGDDAIMPLAAEAAAAGIPMMYMNVDVPEVRAAFGSGYVGATLYQQGRNLGAETLRLAGDRLQPGDTAIVMSRWESENRAQRELGLVDALEEFGMKVIKLQEAEGASADQMLQIPVLTSTLIANPDTKLIGYPGGPWLAAAPVFMDAVGKGPGDIMAVGFDLGQGVMTAFDGGYVTVTADQQPYQQGYLPVLSLCQQLVYKLGPLNVDTGAGFVTADNYKDVVALAEQGVR